MSSNIQFKQLHPILAAEVTGVDFASPISDETLKVLQEAITKYGVLVFRDTGLNDETHAAFAGKFGQVEELTDAFKSNIEKRFPSNKLYDISNLENDDSLIDTSTLKAQFQAGNTMFHADNTYKARRAGYSLLRCVEPTPQGTGGNTEFVDQRRAFDDLPEEWKKELLERDYVVQHSIWHSRKVASPEFFERVDPAKYQMSRHKLVQRHEPSGRLTLLVPSHCHHIEGLPSDVSREKLDFLFKHSTQPKYIVSVPWNKKGDLVMWDNTCTLHRATPLHGTYRRDMRRATCLDSSSNAWGLNAGRSVDDWAAVVDVLQIYGASLPTPKVAGYSDKTHARASVAVQV